MEINFMKAILWLVYPGDGMLYNTKGEKKNHPIISEGYIK